MSKADWKQTQATVFTCGVQDHALPGTVPVPGSTYSDYIVTFSYEIDGEWYSGDFTSPKPREEGSKFSLRYDAHHPEHNEFSIDSTLDNPWVNILVYGITIALVVLYIWYRDFRHH